MTAPVDAGLGFYRQVLSLRAYRQEILSADIANASTPGFKAVDLDFREALGAAQGGGASGGVAPGSVPPQAPSARGRQWLVSDARHIAVGEASPVSPSVAAAVKYQVDGQVSLDGNSVDLDREKLAAATNAVDYEAATAFVSQTIRMLTVAITGSGPQQSGGA